MLVTRCDLNGMQWHLVGFQPTRFLQKQRNADPVEPLKDFSGTKMMAVLKRSPKMVSWIEPCQTLTTSSQWSHAAVGKWRIWSFNANAKRSVKSNGFQLRPTLKLCFLGLHSLKCNEWDMFDARDVRSLKQVASVVAKPGTTKSFLQECLPLSTVHLGAGVELRALYQVLALCAESAPSKWWVSATLLVESTREKPQDGSRGWKLVMTAVQQDTPLLTWVAEGQRKSGEKTRFGLSVLKLPKTKLLGWNDESFTLATKFVDPIWSFGRLKPNTIISWPLRLMSPLYATKLVFCAGGSTYLMQKQQKGWPVGGKKNQKLRKTDPMTSKLRFTWKVASLERLAFPDRHLADPAAWPVFQCPSLDFGKRAMGILRNVKATESQKKTTKIINMDHMRTTSELAELDKQS